MKKPDTPADEQYRLRELRALNLLHTPAEERFDRLTRLAKRLFNVPNSVVALLEDNYLWLKSSASYDPKPIERENTFCAHAILRDDVLVVEDARRDDRFHDNPVVTEIPHIRFYAGCPLRTPGGARVGTLCLFDSKPRRFSEDDNHTLRDLASMAEAELIAFQAATSDELTQITNRRGFITLGQMMLNQCQLRGIHASLTFLDLDKFKTINDTLGHREGDRALMDFADAMKVIFSHADLFARLGGDEFVVLFHDTPQDKAEALLETFTRYLHQQAENLNRRYQLNFSHGVVGFDPQHPLTLEQLLEQSDNKMYRHKQHRHNSRSGNDNPPDDQTIKGLQ
ncbi:GGDEF domain-containing protein [Erwinia sp. OLTSP20]|uniref:sensor domain-containing diguanylate cyclase n=1 Tax=unclassified Erwinia TaxID=2622719 RepID=UPI000C17E3EB|nr:MULTISPECIES: sensor domain-containing diguanylate cyclase [unclassified Erwinia]PIJ51129.1 GGDEF domain-containing protein [Erwinia sp. OAMSP11]PIJ73881.1 GGDEF domain-containing protein [Erwinia sp. OLSSP12]PIJ78387.1 GGDEF domain-containing protein [Erwinia sp. OLCASP19]PIJ86419.1 GGDEF domain-containing protein [Erwinia sp. OLMTSP26]PIJ87898.1 GGDEF domain-containing protein [Erwinia sp. OLMDSP33]